MLLDPYSYVAPSRVKIFLCPCGHIKRSLFLQYAERLAKCREVRLVDVTPDGRADRAMFSPQGYPNGKVVYDFHLSPIEGQLSLYDLEPFRQTLVVCALATYKDNSSDIEKSLKELKRKYPNAILHKILIFGVPDDEEVVQKLTTTRHVIAILSSKASTVNSLQAALCDVTKDFLAELAVYTISKQLGSFKSPGIKELDTPTHAIRPGDKPYNVSFKHEVVRYSPSSSSTSLPSGKIESYSKTGSISMGLTDRSKSKQRGRLLKFTGNMYLLSGRLTDALENFCEAAAILKSAYDHLWYASALESIGVTLVLLAFLEVPIIIPQVALNATLKHSSHPSTSTSEHQSSRSVSPVPSSTPSNGTTDQHATGPKATFSPSTTSIATPSPTLYEFIPDLTDAILRFYSRSQSSAEESVPQLVYCESILRFAKLLTVIRVGGGWNGAVLSAVVRGTSIEKNITPESPSSSVIAGWCSKLYSTDISNLPVLAQCSVYSGLASIYASIDLVRKKTFILRELLVNIIPKIIKSRQQRLSIKQQEQQQQQQPHHQLNYKENEEPQSNGSGPQIVVYSSLLDGIKESDIVQLLDPLCQVYGAGDVLSVGHGWLELKISFLKTCILVCDSVPDLDGVIYYTGILLSTSADMLSKDDQLALFSNLHKALDKCRKQGKGDALATYWDRYILRDIKLIPANSLIAPVRRKESSVKSNDKDVFLYNPFAQPESTDDEKEKVLVQNERAEFAIKLQNPFAFEVQISELSLIAEGDIMLDAVAINVFLPSSTMFEVMLSVVPKVVGNLTITGCRIQIVGCSSMDCMLVEKIPLMSKPLEIERIKQYGVNSGKSWKRPEATAKKIDYSVISAQPMMTLKNMTLSQGWLMLLEGEKHMFNLMLTNISDIIVNSINFKFYDSTIEPLQTALTNKELPLNEMYECEYFLHERRALSRVSNSNSGGVIENDVDVHCDKEFGIQINGKRGMTSATVHIDYGNVQGDDVWTRRLTVPINTTVNASIDMGLCDIIPLQSSFKDTQGFEHVEKIVKGISAESMTNYYLLLVDLRNAWSQPMDVTVSTVVSCLEENKTAQVTKTIYSNRTKRFLLPFIWTPPENPDEAIPLISRKQYIVDSSRNAEQSRLMRETFWYRETLLKLIKGQWRICGSDRGGDVEFRGLRLTPKMVNMLRQDQIEITMSLAGAKKKIGHNYQVGVCSENNCVRTKILNRSREPVKGILRLIPSIRNDPGLTDADGEDEVENRILYKGVLQRPISRAIAPGQSIELELGMVYISRGEYEWTSVFEISTMPNRLQAYSQRHPIVVRVV